MKLAKKLEALVHFLVERTMPHVELCWESFGRLRKTFFIEENSIVHDFY